MAEIDDQNQNVIDAGDLRKYRTELPNLYDDSGLDPYEFRLLAHYKRVGNCWESIRTTAEKCKMSPAQVLIKRRSLKVKGFIAISENENAVGTADIKVVDRWADNFITYCSDGERERLSGKQDSSPRKQKRLPRELKKEHSKKELIKKETPSSQTGEIQKCYESLIGYPLNGEWARGESVAAKHIGERWTLDQLTAAYNHYKADKFWGDKRLTLQYLEKQMPEYFKARKPQQIIDPNEKTLTPDEAVRQYSVRM